MKLNHQRAINFFCQHTNYFFKQVKKCHQVMTGLSNQTYHLITKDQKQFQVRFGDNNGVIDRNNELAILKLLNNQDYLHYNVQNGDSIRHWFDGKNPTRQDFNEVFLSLLVQEIQIIHATEISADCVILKHDNLVFEHLASAQIKPIYWQKYLALDKKYQNLQLVLSHNDISPMNIIWNSADKTLKIIDYEWGRINNDYWDYANFIREADLDFQWAKFIATTAQLDWDILNDFMFMTVCFAVQWTYCMPESNVILNYRDHVIKIMEKYYAAFYEKNNGFLNS